MAPQLSISNRTILDRLRSMSPGGVMSPGSSVIDKMLADYSKAATIPDPVLDGNDPLKEYLNPTPDTTNPPVPDKTPDTNKRNFTPVGIPDDDQWHNLGGKIMMRQMNSKKHPAEVAEFWLRKLNQAGGDGSIENAIPVGNRIGDDTPLTYHYKNLEEYKKDAAKTSQLPPQAHSGKNSGYVKGDSGGNNGNLSKGTYAPTPMPVTSTGTFGDTSNLLGQYTNSSPKPNINIENAIRNKLARLRGGR